MSLGCAAARERSRAERLAGVPDAEPAAEERPDETAPLALVGAVPATKVHAQADATTKSTLEGKP